MGTVLVGGEGGLLIYMTFFATTDPNERAGTKNRKSGQKGVWGLMLTIHLKLCFLRAFQSFDNQRMFTHSS